MSRVIFLNNTGTLCLLINGIEQMIKVYWYLLCKVLARSFEQCVITGVFHYFHREYRLFHRLALLTKLSDCLQMLEDRLVQRQRWSYHLVPVKVRSSFWLLVWIGYPHASSFQLLLSPAGAVAYQPVPYISLMLCFLFFFFMKGS